MSIDETLKRLCELVIADKELHDALVRLIYARSESLEVTTNLRKYRLKKLKENKEEQDNLRREGA